MNANLQPADDEEILVMLDVRSVCKCMIAPNRLARMTPLCESNLMKRMCVYSKLAALLCLVVAAVIDHHGRKLHMAHLCTFWAVIDGDVLGIQCSCLCKAMPSFQMMIMSFKCNRSPQGVHLDGKFV